MTANDVMKTCDVTKNFNEALRIYLTFKYWMDFSILLHLTVSNLIHAGIRLLLFVTVMIFRGCKDACAIVQIVFCRSTIRLISSIYSSETNSMTPDFITSDERILIK